MKLKCTSRKEGERDIRRRHRRKGNKARDETESGPQKKTPGGARREETDKKIMGGSHQHTLRVATTS